MILPIVALIPVAFLISLVATGWARQLGRRLGALDSPGSPGHIKQLRPVPNTGGVGIFMGLALPLATGLLIAAFAPQTLLRLVPGLEPHLPRLIDSLGLGTALLAGCAVLHLTGLIDDRRSLGPLLKLAIQITMAAILVIGFDVRLMTLLGNWPSILLTIAWIVIITNAINFLDNMDGLAAGVCVVAAAFFLAATLVNAQWFIAATLALMIGSCCGFLVFNRPPATIFMGDGGSLVLGFLLGVLTARTTFHDTHDPDFALGGGWYGVFMPVVVLAIPLYDFCSVTTLRILQGKSPFVGDQQHFSHRLVRRGLSTRQAVLVLVALTAVTGIGGVSLGRLDGWQAVLVGLQTILVLLIIALLEYTSKGQKQT